ncbi:MAG: electron transfer flavoprotein subunit beta/FixA family protein [Candidatus Coatesbacteria bacterium]
MKILVLVKQVPDSAAAIKLAGPASIDRSVKPVLNPYDEIAVEEALRIRERSGGEVVLVTLGPPAADGALRAGLAMGADRGVLVTCDLAFPDPRFVGRALAAAIADEGSAGLVLAGLRSIDADGSQIPYRVAATLGWPAVNGITKLELSPGVATVTREADGGDLEILSLPLPCVLGANRGLNQPRYPKLPDLMGAKKKPVRVVDPASLAGVGQPVALAVKGLELPPPRRAARVLEGELGAAAVELVRLLREEAKVL